MADLKGKFQGLDENAKNNYANSFVGATKVAEKVKKGGTENKSDGYVVDAIDIDWGGLKLTTISDTWSFGLQTVESSEQNAGKGDNTQGIHSTAYLLNKISDSFTQIYNEIGKNDDAGLRKKIKTLETSIGEITSSTPEKLTEIKNSIEAINKELDNPGAAGTMLSILDTLKGFSKTENVRKYIDDHDKAILGTPTDEATVYSVYGVRKYVDTTAKNTLIGKAGDEWPTKQTLYGVVKYSDTKNTDLRNNLIGASTDTTINTHYGLKHILIGKPSDAPTADTIWGAKKHAVEQDIEVKNILIGASTDAATANTIWGAKNYANTTVKNSLIGEDGDQTIDTHWGVRFLSYNYTEVAAGNVLGKDGDLWPTKRTVYGVAKYADKKIETLSNTAFKVSRIEEGGEGILVFSTVS